MLFVIVNFAILVIRMNALIRASGGSWGIALSGPSRLTIFVTVLGFIGGAVWQLKRRPSATRH
jgi:hypothetical protein